jgi:hypothetical protein
MAYAPTTWDANDVITKDKLNKIEQGINTASKLSGTDIDTDKDWNGKNITNLGYIEATRIRPEASDEVRWSKSGNVSVTIPQVYTQGTVKISMSVSGYHDGDYWRTRYGTLSIDGVTKKTISAESAPNTLIDVYAVSGGSVVSFSGDGVGAVSISCSDTVPILYPTTTWPV